MHNGSGTDLVSILDAIDEQKVIDQEKLLEFFLDMFIIDALIGNFDRHNGNWGFLLDSEQNIEIAPIFDCGSALLPQADEEMMKKILNNPMEMNNLPKTVYQDKKS